MSTHSKAAEKFIADKERTAWHNQALWFVREKRDRMARSVPEWEALREAAARTKIHTVTHLAHYLEMFERNATANGIHVHWAKDAQEHNEIVYGILKEHGVRHLVKSKSMLAEECGLSPYLEERGIEAVESDLGERIMQLMHRPPSHIVLPAIHVKRQEVGELFEREIGTEHGNSDPTYLTHAARGHLRDKFLHADAAMTGVNFAVASSGAFVVCTNEGNADMGTSFPKLHIAIMGLEKVIPDYDALAIYHRLLARSATGQHSTTYTTHYKRPVEGQEMHIVIVDNGRSRILGNPVHRNMLKCLRCGACMNTCPVYRTVQRQRLRMQPLHVLLQCLPRQDRPRRADLLLETGTRLPRTGQSSQEGHRQGTQHRPAQSRNVPFLHQGRTARRENSPARPAVLRCQRLGPRPRAAGIHLPHIRTDLERRAVLLCPGQPGQIRGEREITVLQ